LDDGAVRHCCSSFSTLARLSRLAVRSRSSMILRVSPSATVARNDCNSSACCWRCDRISLSIPSATPTFCRASPKSARSCASSVRCRCSASSWCCRAWTTSFCPFAAAVRSRSISIKARFSAASHRSSDFCSAWRSFSSSTAKSRRASAKAVSKATCWRPAASSWVTNAALLACSVANSRSKVNARSVAAWMACTVCCCSNRAAARSFSADT
jgi:hypothetical protein